MRRMTRRTKFLIIARAIFLFFAVSVVAVVVALSKIDTNSLRENILGILRSSTGMPVEIAGDVSWKLSLRPHVVINKITVPNAPGEKHKNLFEADTLEVRLNLLSLFRNRPTIQHVRIKNGKLFWNDNINAENNKDDKNTDTAESAAQGEIQKTEYPFMDPGLGGIDVVNFEINVDDEKYFLPRVNIRAGNFEKNREYRGWIKLKKNVIPFILSFDKYNAERKVYPVKFAFSSEGDTLIANIALEGTSKIPIDFIIKGDIPDVRPIGDMLNIELPKMPEIKVNISGGLGHSKVTVHKSSISVRGSDINFSGALDWSKKR
ncbi:MAG: AsmA family protein, partial [Alphaproteobacteria bacterium]|nr:AsmA family protein [Alphaproteobacteria bacterium]